MRYRLAGLLSGLAFVALPGAFAQQAAPPPPAFAPANTTQEGARAMASTCAACHGTHGKAAPGAAVAGLAGRPAGETIQAMKDFREGKRPATLMHQIAKGFSEPEVAAMAEYFARQQ